VKPPKWIAGSPDGPGDCWIVWLGTEVHLVNIGPAVLNPDGQLLLKFSRGMAYAYEVNRKRITHWMPVIRPEPPEVTRG
jgi:hypothetical protein